MAETAAQNDQMPTDPTTILIFALAVTTATSQLTTDQAQAIVSLGGIAELIVLGSRLFLGRR